MHERTTAATFLSQLPQKAAEAYDENAWAFWLEVERAVKELLMEATPPGTTQH